MPSRATGAERDSVMRIGDGGKQAVVILFPVDDSRKPENIPRRIVGVNSHIYACIVAHRHYSVKEIHKILKRFLVRHTLILFKQSVQLFGRITFVPTGQTQIMFIKFIKINFAVRKQS